MIRNKLDKVTLDFYEVTKDYKYYFCKLKTNLKEKNNIEKVLLDCIKEIYKEN